MIKDQLLEGRTVQYKSSGNSLRPQVYSNDTCCLEPVCGSHELAQIEIRKDDIVFCEVNPGFHFYAHKVLRIEGCQGTDDKVYVIGNNKGFENGWCHRDQIYGRLIEAVYCTW